MLLNIVVFFVLLLLYFLDCVSFTAALGVNQVSLFPTSGCYPLNLAFSSSVGGLVVICAADSNASILRYLLNSNSPVPMPVQSLPSYYSLSIYSNGLVVSSGRGGYTSSGYQLLNLSVIDGNGRFYQSGDYVLTSFDSIQSYGPNSNYWITGFAVPEDFSKIYVSHINQTQGAATRAIGFFDFQNPSHFVPIMKMSTTCDINFDGVTSTIIALCANNILYAINAVTGNFSTIVLPSNFYVPVGNLYRNQYYVVVSQSGVYILEWAKFLNPNNSVALSADIWQQFLVPITPCSQMTPRMTFDVRRGLLWTVCDVGIVSFKIDTFDGSNHQQIIATLHISFSDSGPLGVRSIAVNDNTGAVYFTTLGSNMFTQQQWAVLGFMPSNPVCPDGLYSDSILDFDCKPCPTGFTCVRGVQIPCSPGWVCSQPGLASPNAPCNASTYCPPGSIYPTLAPLGFAAPFDFMSVPIACNLSFYCGVGTKDETLTPCPGGFFCKNPSTLEICPIGYYCPIGSIQPHACGAADLAASLCQFAGLAAVPVLPNASTSSAQTITWTIILACVSGGMAMLFFIIRFFIGYYGNKYLQQILDGSCEDEVKRKEYIKKCVKPIVLKVFERVQTTGIFGYRGEKKTKSYYDNIQVVIAAMQDCGIMPLNQLDPPHQVALLSVIGDAFFKFLGRNDSCLSWSRIRSLFKPDSEPQQFLDCKDVIAAHIRDHCSPSLRSFVSVTINDHDDSDADSNKSVNPLHLLNTSDQSRVHEMSVQDSVNFARHSKTPSQLPIELCRVSLVDVTATTTN